MATSPPAVEQVVDAVVARLTGIQPSVDPATRFRRSAEATEAAAARRRRAFDVDFVGTRDLSALGQGIVTVGFADHETRLRIDIGYPFVAPGERALERQLASDTAHLLRAFNRSGWAGTPVQSATAAVTVAEDEGAKVLQLDLVVRYRDTL